MTHVFILIIDLDLFLLFAAKEKKIITQTNPVTSKSLHGMVKLSYFYSNMIDFVYFLDEKNVVMIKIYLLHNWSFSFAELESTDVGQWQNKPRR